MMTAEGEIEYTDDLIRLLEIVWGDGFLSPGGTAAVDQVVDGIDLRGKTVLDIGCGSGGVTLHLVETFEPARIIGIDVEVPVLEHARRRAEKRGLVGIVDFQQVTPGRLPFEDGTFDVVFSKDAIVHIPDKETLFRDLFRVLRPGGWFAASDWMISHDDEPTPRMKAYIEKEGLSFGMASPKRYTRAMRDAGFEDVETIDRNPWYRDVARQEVARMSGPLYDTAVAAVGRDFVDHNISLWNEMIGVLDTGEHRPTLIRGHKPG